MIEPPFLEEFRNSAISDRLARVNVSWVDGEEAVRILAEQAIAECQRVQSYTTVAARRILDRYAFAANGGWVAYGCELDGTSGQVAYFKPANPRKELKNGQLKTIRYEGPAKSEALPILPWVDSQTAQEIYQQYGVAPLEGETFWQVVQRCNLPIAITEGLKKALALIDHGIPAIAIRGITQWHFKGSLELHKAIAQFVSSGREWIIVFDQDSKPKTIQNSNIQIRKLGAALELQGCCPKVLLWTRSLGKGIDDALIQKLPEERKKWLFSALNSAPTLKEWKQGNYETELLSALAQQSELLIEPEQLTSGQYLPELPAIEAGKIHILDSGVGTGKTRRIGQLIREMVALGWNVLALSPMNSLGQQSAERWAIPHVHDYDLENPVQDQLFCADIKNRHGVVLCPDSLNRIPDCFWHGDRRLLVILDEANQVADHIVHGGTLKNRQPEIVERLAEILEVAGQCGAILLSEDGVRPRTVKLIKRLSRAAKLGFSNINQI